jgi:hypothetical protein
MCNLNLFLSLIKKKFTYVYLYPHIWQQKSNQHILNPPHLQFKGAALLD